MTAALAAQRPTAMIADTRAGNPQSTALRPEAHKRHAGRA